MTQAEYDIFLRIVELFMVLVQSALLLMLWRAVFHTKREKSAMIAAAVFLAVNLAAKLPFSVAWIRYLAVFAFAMGYCRLRYRGYYEKAVFVLLLFYHFHSLNILISNSLRLKVETLLMSGMDRMQSGYPYQFRQKMVVSALVLMVVYIALMLFMLLVSIRVLKNVEMDRRDALLFSAYSLSGGVLAGIVSDLYAVKVGNAVFYLYDAKKEMFWKIPLMAGCIFVGELLLIYFWKNYRMLLEERQKRFVEEKQVQAMKRRLEEAEDFYGNVRKIRHEMKNHLANLKGLAAGEQYGEIAAYVSKMDETMQELECRYATGNALTDVIVNDRWRRAKKLGIEFEAEFRPVEGISPFDVGMILGNLLDNAIEACEKDRQEKRFIRLRVKQKKQFFLIDVENSFDGKLRWQEGSPFPLSTKERTAPPLMMEHGIGLKNVSDIAERYYGGVSIKVKKQIFQVTVMLQREQNRTQNQ